MIIDLSLGNVVVYLISGIPAIYNPFYLTSNSMIDMQETIKEK
jgi:hypothetical protein